MNKLTHFLKLTQEELKVEVYNYLRQIKMNPIFDDGFVYAEGDIPILLVAHMDTVFDEPPKRLFYNKKKDKIFNPDGGLGGDDRCGVYAIIKLLGKYRPHILFTEDEEIGCIGAGKAVDKLPKPKVKYIIEFDRRGKNDCVFYDCGNEDFMDYIESFGFVTDYGTCSDISVLGSEWDIASVNLSSGYYYEHTEKEHIIFHELIKTINRVEEMLKMYKKAPYFDYQEIKYTSRYSTVPFYDNWTDEDLLLWIEQFYGANRTQVTNNQTHTTPQEEPRKLVLKKKENPEDRKVVKTENE